MEAATTSETSANFYQDTRITNPKDSNLNYKEPQDFVKGDDFF
jgi:hypothetical protein